MNLDGLLWTRWLELGDTTDRAGDGDVSKGTAGVLSTENTGLVDIVGKNRDDLGVMYAVR